MYIDKFWYYFVTDYMFLKSKFHEIEYLNFDFKTLPFFHTISRRKKQISNNSNMAFLFESL